MHFGGLQKQFLCFQGIPVPFDDPCPNPGHGTVAAALGAGVSYVGESLFIL